MGLCSDALKAKKVSRTGLTINVRITRCSPTLWDLWSQA